MSIQGQVGMNNDYVKVFKQINLDSEQKNSDHAHVGNSKKFLFFLFSKSRFSVMSKRKRLQKLLQAL